MEYINQFTLKSDIASEEFRRISAEKDDLKNKTEAEMALLKDKIAVLEAAAKAHVVDSPLDDAPADTVPEKGNEQENIVSCDDETSKLREQLTELNLKIDILKEELATAKEQATSTSQDAQKAKHEPTESGDDGVLAQSKSDPRDAEIALLKEAFENSQQKLREAETRVETLETEITGSRTKLQLLIENSADIQEDIKAFKRNRNDEQTPATGKQPELAPETPKATMPTSGSGKKKNRKKKKGGDLQAISESDHDEMSKSTDSSSPGTPAINPLSAELSALKDRYQLIYQENFHLKADLENRLHDIETLQQSLIANGEDVTEAKSRNKELQEKAATLQMNISELEKARDEANKKLDGWKILVSEAQQQVSIVAEQNAECLGKLKDLEKSTAEIVVLRKLVDELNIKNHTLESDLGASQKLAQDRFKELTKSKEILAGAQTEMKKQQENYQDLITTRKNLSVAEMEVDLLKKREQELKSQVGRLQRLSDDRESEINLLNDRISIQKKSRDMIDEEKKKVDRDYSRLAAEKAEVIAKAEKISKDFKAAQLELSSLRPKAKVLEDDVARLQKEKTVAKEEVDLKTQQYQSAQGLLASMRAENKELETQLKEAQNQAESLQEELAEAHKHLAERTRETETMRRRLKEETEKADGRVNDMKAQMDAAIEDRDRIEDETSTLARRRAREAEELKNRVRELERESKALRTEKDALEASERQWRQRREELEQIEEKATAETEDMRSTASSLRSALDASEQQVRDAEKQKANLRKLLDEAQSRYERANKELKSVQSKLNLGNGSNATRNGGPSASTVKSSADTTYLKTVFVQFLEAEDGVRLQLIPVILKLFGFSKCVAPFTYSPTPSTQLLTYPQG